MCTIQITYFIGVQLCLQLLIYKALHLYCLYKSFMGFHIKVLKCLLSFYKSDLNETMISSQSTTDSKFHLDQIYKRKVHI